MTPYDLPFPQNGAPKCTLCDKSNIQWPYLCNGPSSPFHVLFYGRFKPKMVAMTLGTCESFIFVRIESAVYHASRNTACRPSVFCICTPNWLSTCLFDSVIKRAKQCCCTLILLPKFRIGPSIRIESRIGRTIRNRIESRSFAGPYMTRHDKR